MAHTADDLELLLSLIRQAATLEQMVAFLSAAAAEHARSRGAKAPLFSASSKDELFEKRVRPALAAGQLAFEDLLNLLRASEEFGRQHVFLYSCPPEKARLLMADERVRAGLRRAGAAAVLDRPRLVDLPPAIRIVDARWEEEDERDGVRQYSFLLKLVEPRTYRSFLDEKRKGGIVTRRYRVETVRAVHLFHLHPEGLLELRVQAHRNSTRYEEDVERLWRLAAPVLARQEFGIHRIDKAKAALWHQKKELAGEVAYNDSMLRNDSGTVLSAATGKETASLFDDRGAATSLDGFLAHGGYCDALNVRFLAAGDGGPADLGKTLRVLFPPGLNELAITAHCSREDHSYVLARILELNR